MADHRSLYEKLRDFEHDAGASPAERATAKAKADAIEAQQGGPKRYTASDHFTRPTADPVEDMVNDWMRRSGFRGFEPGFTYGGKSEPPAMCARCEEPMVKHSKWEPRNGPPVYPCQMSNGHLMASINLVKKMPPSGWRTTRMNFLNHEKERRERVGWEATRGPRP